MSEHSVIYLSSSNDPEREWCREDVWKESVRYNLGTDFDAQRLRADTAEAEVAALREELVESKGARERLHTSLGRARSRRDEVIHERDDLQQRIADLIALIGKAHTWVDRNNFGGWDAYELRDQLAAALNPNPEAERPEVEWHDVAGDDEGLVS